MRGVKKKKNSLLRVLEHCTGAGVLVLLILSPLEMGSKCSILMPLAQTLTSYLLLHYLSTQHTTWFDTCKRAAPWKSCDITNRSSIIKQLLSEPHENAVFTALNCLTVALRKICLNCFAPFSLSLSISMCSMPKVSLKDLIRTLGHTWVDSRRKEGVFLSNINTRVALKWKITTIFAWARSKSPTFFCLWCLGLKFPSFHAIPIAQEHQSEQRFITENIRQQASVRKKMQTGNDGQINAKI